MRIRQIKPSWWLDKDLRTRLSAEAREFYIGLWMLADDGGWLVWDVTRIAAELYPYGVNGGGLFDSDPITDRERAVSDWSELLRTLEPAAPHLVVWECGHAQVPKMTAHQRSGGRPVTTVRDIHRSQCAQRVANARRGKERNGTERKGNGSDGAHLRADARAPSPLDDAMAAEGGFAAKLVKHA